MRNTWLALATIFAGLTLAACGGESGGSNSGGNGGNTAIDLDDCTSEQVWNGEKCVDKTVTGDVNAPYSYSQFTNTLKQSNLQVSDINGEQESSNQTTVAKGSELEDYFSDHFYYDVDADVIVFSMSGHSLRSEVRVQENFRIDDDMVRTLSAKIKPIDPDTSLINADAKDEITYLQLHNKGLDQQNSLSWPILRVVYEKERDGKQGHYWAVLAENVDVSTEDRDYDRFDLGEADLTKFTQFDLAVHQGTLSITVDGEVKVEKKLSTWLEYYGYFKVGVYNNFTDGSSSETDQQATAHFQTLTYSVKEYQKSHVWDLNQWKITLPASKNDWYGSGGTSAAEVTPCDDFSNDSNLYSNKVDLSFFEVIDGRMHFRADMGYGTTTTNSSYIRSELRELFNRGSSCSTSSDATSWKINDTATGTTTHRLTSTLRIEKYPNISGQDPKVIVGQVHGYKIDQALVKLLWEGNSKPVRVILNRDFEQNNSSCSSGCNFSVDMGTYAAGKDWTYTIEVNGEGVLLKTQYADGSNAKSHTLKWGDKLVEAWADSKYAYYFKAGIYPQFKPNSSYVGKTFDVSFSEVNITHQ